LLGIDAGTLTIGHAADICIFDPDAHWIVDRASLKSQGKNTPFLGLEVPGRVQHTLIDGVPDGHSHGGTADPLTGEVPATNVSTYNVGGQIDFETHRFYSSFSTDLFDSAVFWHRADTLQVGFSPYRHDANGLATWLIVSGRNYSGVYEKSELAFLIRLFRKRTWLEAGATTDGKIQALAMFNF
jgi:hypothetical protein